MADLVGVLTVYTIKRQAREAIKVYRKQSTPEALAQTVMLREDLTFSRQSLLFERAELAANSERKDFAQAFKQAIKQLTESRER